VVDFGVVQLDEECVTEEQSTAAKTAEEQRVADEEAAADAAKAAEEQTAKDEAAAEQAARDAETEQRRVEAEAKAAAEAAPVNLTEMDINACAALAGGSDLVVTEQDRADLARAVRAYSDDSPDQRFVDAGRNLTDYADSWTGFMWSGSVGIFSDLCIRGGYNELPNVQ